MNARPWLHKAQRGRWLRGWAIIWTVKGWHVMGLDQWLKRDRRFYPTLYGARMAIADAPKPKRLR
jgi:hypothetical protein